MSTLQQRAEGLELWATEGATPQEVASKLIELDRDALNWHVARMVLPRDQIERMEHMAMHLIANGYEPPAG